MACYNNNAINFLKIVVFMFNNIIMDNVASMRDHLLNKGRFDKALASSLWQRPLCFVHMALPILSIILLKFNFADYYGAR